MSFAKLDSGIINSSIWSEPLETRVLWITILAMKDENGFVATAKSGLQRAANITSDQFDIAIKCLESPDEESRTADYDGRRVEKVEGGWIVLNNDKYKLREDLKREQTRKRVALFRERQKESVTPALQRVTSVLPSVSVSNSVSVSKEEECEKEKKIKTFVQPTVEEVSQYCKERNNGVDPVKFWNFYESKGWMVGKTKMKNWKACVHTWEKPMHTGPEKPKHDFSLPKNYRSLCTLGGEDD